MFLQPVQGEMIPESNSLLIFVLMLGEQQAAVSMLAKTLAMEWRSMGVTVNW